MSRDIPTVYRTGYSFPLTIVTREGAFNAAENRNYGANLIRTDAISFFDAVDHMHPQRIELLVRALADSDVVLHSHAMGSPGFTPIETPRMYQNALRRGPTGCVLYAADWTANVHHGHVTLRKSVMDFVRFPEDWAAYTRKEDTLFCGMLVSMRHLRTMYIADDLSWYRLTHSLDIS